jgi:hypothetical protein
MKLSQTQRDVLEKLEQNPGARMVRVSGGFWTYSGCPGLGATRMLPNWSVTVQTIRAMEKLGLLRRANIHPEEWRDERALVQESLAVTNFIVWRVEDDAGNGPYHKTNLQRLGGMGIFGYWEETQQTPGIERDFSPEQVKAYYEGSLRSGFASVATAVQWFTQDGIAALAQHGLTLRTRVASRVFPGKSNLQVLFQPTEK